MFNQLRGMKDQWLWVVPVLRLTIKLNSTNSGGLQFLGHVQLFVTPEHQVCSAHQAPLSFTISRSLLRFMSIESVMPSNYFIHCRPLLLPSIFPSIRAFSNELAIPIKWPKYWSFIFSISPSIEYSGLISFETDWLDLLAVKGALS